MMKAYVYLANAVFDMENKNAIEEAAIKIREQLAKHCKTELELEQAWKDITDKAVAYNEKRAKTEPEYEVVEVTSTPSESNVMSTVWIIVFVILFLVLAVAFVNRYATDGSYHKNGGYGSPPSGYVPHVTVNIPDTQKKKKTVIIRRKR